MCPHVVSFDPPNKLVRQMLLFSLHMLGNGPQGGKMTSRGLRERTVAVEASLQGMLAKYLGHTKRYYKYIAGVLI